MNRDDLVRVDIVVSLWLDCETDTMLEVLEDLDYEFTHPCLKDSEIVDVLLD